MCAFNTRFLGLSRFRHVVSSLFDVVSIRMKPMLIASFQHNIVKVRRMLCGDEGREQQRLCASSKQTQMLFRLVLTVSANLVHHTHTHTHTLFLSLSLLYQLTSFCVRVIHTVRARWILYYNVIQLNYPCSWSFSTLILHVRIIIHFGCSHILSVYVYIVPDNPIILVQNRFQRCVCTWSIHGSYVILNTVFSIFCSALSSQSVEPSTHLFNYQFFYVSIPAFL